MYSVYSVDFIQITDLHQLCSMSLSSLDGINKRSRGLGCGAIERTAGGSLVLWVGAWGSHVAWILYVLTTTM